MLKLAVEAAKIEAKRWLDPTPAPEPRAGTYARCVADLQVELHRVPHGGSQVGGVPRLREAEGRRRVPLQAVSRAGCAGSRHRKHRRKAMREPMPLPDLSQFTREQLVELVRILHMGVIEASRNFDDAMSLARSLGPTRTSCPAGEGERTT